jgi:hypothetical protein
MRQTFAIPCILAIVIFVSLTQVAHVQGTLLYVGQNEMILESVNDTISSSTSRVSYEEILNIFVVNSGTDPLLGHLTYTVEADNITHVEHLGKPGYTILWNSSYAHWVYPPDFVIAPPEIGNTPWSWAEDVTWKTSESYTAQIPFSMNRTINRTTFETDGYQEVNFTLVFDDVSMFEELSGSITAENSPIEYVDASIVTGSFTTDAPLRESYTTIRTHSIYYNLDKRLIQAGYPYKFSFVIRVNLTNNGGLPVFYVPSIRTSAFHPSLDRAPTGIVSGSMCMPGDMLPPNIHSACVSTNVSTGWEFKYVPGKALKFNEICRKMNAGPVADFGSNRTSGIAPLTVQFTDTSTGSPADWLWDFGDGTTATTQHPVHRYATSGNFTVTLTVTSGSASDTEAKPDYIRVYPHGDLTQDDVVSWSDVIVCAYMSWGLIDPESAADFDASGTVDWTDVVRLAYYQWGLSTEL